ncbi:MAG: SNF2-related protein [Myxococcota bacterium]
MPGSAGPAVPHPLTRRLRVEELVRLRRADDEGRYLQSQRAGRIDANPHQIDAVIFALRRIREGGCILADEVGLGKTIEAGLVIAQLLAEGARRVLLIAPKPLLGQWREELHRLFDLPTREGKAESGAFDGDGVFLVGRELAGTRAVAGLLAKADPFDLCVIDEAHELFAGIWRRYDAAGHYQDDSPHAKTAAAVRDALLGTPVLLLTATPIQNQLQEIWGLVQYVEPTGTLLGDLPTFRQVFTEGGDGRRLAAGTGDELRRRLGEVVQRTLRRQAQEFMEQPFVGRSARTFEYRMSPEERALYDDVTRYLLTPGSLAFRGSHRALLLLGFHRRMASSKAALAASLGNVVRRLERMLRAAQGGRFEDDDTTARTFDEDLDDAEIREALADAESRDEGEVPNPEAVAAELERVGALRQRAEALTEDSTARAVNTAVRTALGPTGGGKVVLFTESLTTQDYLRDLLVEAAVVREDDITLFRGTNVGPAAQRALLHWEAEVEAAGDGRARPSRAVAVRLALVHEFRTRTKVFIATEAGAKGLNLQFCDTLINVDLPWNPQRIEQRIGRVHRYGQTRDVTVINFLAADNDAQRLTFEILAQKLELFGTVLGASDEVLFAAGGERDRDALTSSLGATFEKELSAIYRRARTVGEIHDELVKLRESTESKRAAFDDAHARTRGLIETRLDAAVQRSFRQLRERVPDALAKLDAELEAVVRGFVAARGGTTLELGERRFRVSGVGAAPDGTPLDLEVRVGEGGLHRAHPLVAAAIAEARQATEGRLSVHLRDAPAEAGPSGRLLLLRVRFDGFEPEERLYPLAFDAAGAELPRPVAEALVRATPTDAPLAPGGKLSEETLEDAIDALLFEAQAEVEAEQERRFDGWITRLERYANDRVRVLGRERAALLARLETLRAERDRAAGQAFQNVERRMARVEEKRAAVDAELLRLRERDDERYRVQRARAEAKRFAPPEVERLLDVDWTSHGPGA